MSHRPLVVVTADPSGAIVGVARAALEETADVELLARDGPERQALLQAADVLLVGAWRLDDEEIGHLGRVRLVQSVWAGVDRLPVAALAAAQPRVVVAAGGSANAPQVAEHAVALYLDCARGVSLRDRAMRRGAWLQDLPAQRVAGTRVAVVGYGAIGSRVGRALAALGVRVTAVNQSGRSDDAAVDAATTLDGLRPLLGELDGVVLAVPLDRTTRGLVDARFLRAMPDEGILVNVGRGPLVVEADLYAHLVLHPGFCAGLDALWRYPRGKGAHYQALPFHTLENVVLTPHSAFQAPGAQEAMVRDAAANVRRFIAGEAIRGGVDPGRH